MINGEKISYGFGWERGALQGSPMIHHGGGIFGYTTFGLYLPLEDVYVIGLSNCDCGNVTSVTMRAAAIALGKPIPSVNDAMVLSEEQLSKWIGSYEFERGVIRYVTQENGKIFSQREGSTKLQIYPMSEDRYIFEDGMIEYNFEIKAGKKIATFVNAGEKLIGNEIDKAPPTARLEIELDSKQLTKYVGKYELAPTFHIVISTADGHLYAQATGQPQFELFAESETDFFFKVVEAQVVFTLDDTGEVTMLTLLQGGGVMPGKKIE